MILLCLRKVTPFVLTVILTIYRRKCTELSYCDRCLDKEIVKQITFNIFIQTIEILMKTKEAYSPTGRNFWQPRTLQSYWKYIVAVNMLMLISKLEIRNICLTIAKGLFSRSVKVCEGLHAHNLAFIIVCHVRNISSTTSSFFSGSTFCVKVPAIVKIKHKYIKLFTKFILSSKFILSNTTVPY